MDIHRGVSKSNTLLINVSGHDTAWICQCLVLCNTKMIESEVKYPPSAYTEIACHPLVHKPVYLLSICLSGFLISLILFMANSSPLFKVLLLRSFVIYTLNNSTLHSLSVTCAYNLLFQALHLAVSHLLFQQSK